MNRRRNLLTIGHVRPLVVVIGLIFAVLPMSADVGVRGDLIHELELESGTTHSGSVTLENYSDRFVEVKLYQTDFRSESPETYFYEDPGSHGRSNANWIDVSPNRVTIASGETFAVSYVIRVPENIELEGTYWSVLMVEPIAADSPESVESDPNETTVGIRTVIRYGVKLVTNIGSTGTYEPSIEGAVIEYIDGVPVLGLDIRNTGTRLLKLEVAAELYSASGSLVARREGPLSHVYPGSSRRLKVPLADVEGGSYTALVVMDGGENNVFGASFPMQIE